MSGRGIKSMITRRETLWGLLATPLTYFLPKRKQLKKVIPIATVDVKERIYMLDMLVPLEPGYRYSWGNAGKSIPYKQYACMVDIEFYNEYAFRGLLRTKEWIEAWEEAKEKWGYKPGVKDIWER
jgi:hypothetical protein